MKALAPGPTTATTPARRPSGVLQRKCACAASGPCGCPDERQQKGAIQRSAAAAATGFAAPPLVQRALQAPGRPLEARTRTAMESSFGHDFGQVRVHTGGVAGESARAVNANAYTVGNHIVFDHGRYQPQSPAGRRLLAHELTHTLQQRGMQRSADGLGGLAVGASESPFEAEADRTADHVMRGGGPPAVRQVGPQGVLSRAPKKAAGAPDPDAFVGIKADAYKPVPAGLAAKGVTKLFQSPAADMPSLAMVTTFPLPEGKGPKAHDLYTKVAAAKQLQAVVHRGNKAWSPALKQFGANTADLKVAWLQKVGWTADEAGKRWFDSGGDSITGADWKPQVGGKTCDMDHVLELQIGGVNASENVQVLDPGPNRSSGSTLRAYIEGLATAIGAEIDQSPSDTLLITFAKVPDGTATVGKPTGPGKATTCLEVECNLKTVVGTDKQGNAPVDGVLTRVYSGAIGESVFLPKTGRLVIDEATNKSVALLVPGFVLKHYDVATGKGKSKQDTIRGVLDAVHTTGKRPTKVPVELDSKLKGKELLFKALDDGAEDVAVAPAGGGGSPTQQSAPRRKLEFAEKGFHLRLVYPYLSPVDITVSSVTEAGISGTGSLVVDRLPVLKGRKLAVELTPDILSATLAGDTTGGAPIPGARISKASLSATLLPELGLKGEVGLDFGPANRPVASALLQVTATPAGGIVVSGDLVLKIPRLEKAGGHIEWTPDGGWKGSFEVATGQIGIPLVKSSSLVVSFNDAGPLLSGSVDLQVGDQLLTLSALRQKDHWVFSGKGTFNVPPIGPVGVALTHDGEHLTGGGWTTFDLQGFKGRIDAVYNDGRVTGTGKLTRKEGKLSGDVSITLKESGALTAEGKVAYELKPGMTAQVGVVVDEKRKVTLSGEMTFPDVELFGHFGKSVKLFKAPDIDIPIFGVSAGPVSIGIVATITGGVDADYGVGPGVLRKLHLGGSLDPLEPDPNPNLHGGAELHIPFGGGIEPWVQAGIGLSAGIAKVTGNIRAGARVGLDGAFDASIEIAYADHSFSIDSMAAIKVHPALAFILSANVEASAIGYGVVYHKDLASKRFEVGSNLEFGVAVPVKYVHGKPFQAPSFDKITFTRPDINAGDMLKSLAVKAGL